jgi:hypothetical protein
MPRHTIFKNLSKHTFTIIHLPGYVAKMNALLKLQDQETTLQRRLPGI